MKRTVLLVGDTGYLGASLVEPLSSHFELTGLSRKRGLSKKIRKIQLDFELDVEKLLEVVAQFDCIIWAAGLSPIDSLNNKKKDYFLTVSILRKVLSELSNFEKKPKFIYFSSKYIYGNFNQMNIVESELEQPQTDYGMNRYVLLKEIVTTRKKYKLDASMVVLPGVYGYNKSEQTYKGAINSMVYSAVKSKLLSLYQTSRFLKNVLHVDDFSDAITAMCLNEAPLKHPMYNLANSQEVTIEIVSEIIRSELPEIEIRQHVNQVYGMFEKGDLTLSSEQFMTEFHWCPTHDLSASLKLMMKHLVKEEKKD